MRTGLAAFFAAALGCLLEGMQSGGLVTLAVAALGTGRGAWWAGRHPPADPHPAGMVGGTAGAATVLIAARLSGFPVAGSMAAMLLMSGGMGAMLGEALGHWVAA